jgi:hypothetical protein
MPLSLDDYTVAPKDLVSPRSTIYEIDTGQVVAASGLPGCAGITAAYVCTGPLPARIFHIPKPKIQRDSVSTRLQRIIISHLQSFASICLRNYITPQPPGEQYWLVLTMEHAGKVISATYQDFNITYFIEHRVFPNDDLLVPFYVDQVLNAMIVVVVLEEEIELEHRDIHLGNICLRKASKPRDSPLIGTSGYDASLVDWGLARATNQLGQAVGGRRPFLTASIEALSRPAEIYMQSLISSRPKGYFPETNAGFLYQLIGDIAGQADIEDAPSRDTPRDVDCYQSAHAFAKQILGDLSREYREGMIVEEWLDVVDALHAGHFGAGGFIRELRRIFLPHPEADEVSLPSSLGSPSTSSASSLRASSVVALSAASGAQGQWSRASSVPGSSSAASLVPVPSRASSVPTPESPSWTGRLRTRRRGNFT